MMNNHSKLAKSLIFIGILTLTSCQPNIAVEAESPITIDVSQVGISKNNFIIENGVSEYKIVIPALASGTIELAAKELQFFFHEASAINLPIIRDTNLIYHSHSKFISLGDTNLFYQTKISKSENLGPSGVQIETLNQSIFLLGGDEKGVLNATYDLLSALFNFEYFGNECYSLDRNVSSLRLRLFHHFIDQPDIPYRMSTSGTNTYNLTEMMRFRQQDWYTSVFTMINSLPWHNCFEYISHAVEGHEDYWYSDDRTQLCYTAHGDPEEYELMQQACLESLIRQVVEYGDKNAATLTMTDGNTYCTCPACQEILNHYHGAVSALHISFCNDLRSRLEDWFNTEDGLPHKRDFTLYFFAYMGASDAPVNYDQKTGAFSLIDGFHCRDGVSVLYAPIDMEYRMPMDHKYNANYVRQLHAWTHVAKDIYVWTYDWCFRSYFVPFDTFDVLPLLYREMKSAGQIKYHFQEGGHYMKEGGSCWEALKIYLNAKLAWDCTLDLNKLIDNFFKYYFAEASVPMRQAFDAFRVYSAYLKKNSPDYLSRQSNQKDFYVPDYWPKGLEDKINGLMDKALRIIKKIKAVDEERYSLLYNRITLEKLSPLYLLIYFYGSELSTEQLADYRLQFKTYIENLGITIGDYGDPIEDTMRKLGIKV